MKNENTSSIFLENIIQNNLSHTDTHNLIRSGHWTSTEHNKYLEFLYQSQDLIESSSNNKGQRLFKRMSQIIGTRSPSQCRSHHQKFNPYNTIFKKKGKKDKILKNQKNSFLQMKSKQYFRKIFYQQKQQDSQSIIEQESNNNNNIQ